MKSEYVLFDRGASSEAVQTALPSTPEDVRNFVGSDFCSLRYGSDDHAPHENDIYTMSAHDLISAFRWWQETTVQAATSGGTR